MLVVLVYLQPFQHNSLLKFAKPVYFGFKVIDVDTPKKVITSAHYDEQHICAYLQQFSH